MPKIKKMLDVMDVINVVTCIIPQLDFLADVLCAVDGGISEQGAAGFSGIIYSISKELRLAILEVPNDTDK
jgi:hypothetical protein